MRPFIQGEGQHDSLFSTSNQANVYLKLDGLQGTRRQRENLGPGS